MYVLMDRFTLKEDEYLQNRCGEIFFTTKGRILIHCTLCEDVFCGFESYEAHLNKIHASNLCIKLEVETADEDSVNCFEIKLNNTELDYEDVLEVSASNTLNIDTSEDASKTFPDSLRSSKFFHDSSKPLNDKKPDCIKEISIQPTVVREVIKRNVYITGKTTPGEERKHKCPICGFAFKTKNNLTHHVKRHSNEKNYACTDCDKRFYTSTELNTHLRTHTQERPFLCTECGETFTTQGGLGGHFKRHRGQKDYSCQYSGCQKAFYNSQLLKRHMLSHSNERRLRCPICNAAFKQKTALKNHIKLHDNKKEFKCKICGTEYNQTAGLHSHMKTVHKAL